MSKDTPPSKGSPPSKEELDCLAYAREQAHKAPERVEEAAKYLAGIIAISLTIFFWISVLSSWQIGEIKH